AALETRLPVVVRDGPPVTLRADGDQLDQLLINLVRNAVDASLESRGEVCVGWARQNGTVSITVEDDGPGLANPANLFVPFFTTKPEGSGIGLVLSRQIAESHGGSLGAAIAAASRQCGCAWIPKRAEPPFVRLWSRYKTVACCSPVRHAPCFQEGGSHDEISRSRDLHPSLARLPSAGARHGRHSGERNHESALHNEVDRRRRVARRRSNGRVRTDEADIDQAYSDHEGSGW